MPSENIKSRVRRGVTLAIRELGLPGFNKQDAEKNILNRVNPLAANSADDLRAPAIVVSPYRVERRPSPAGMRQRSIDSLVSVYLLKNSQGQPDKETQEEITETILAAFDLPREMPVELLGEVPEADECRATTQFEFRETAYPTRMDVHRLIVTVEVCQLAGVVS